MLAPPDTNETEITPGMRVAKAVQPANESDPLNIEVTPRSRRSVSNDSDPGFTSPSLNLAAVIDK